MAAPDVTDVRAHEGMSATRLESSIDLSEIPFCAL
jgi:hypothetical protein